MRYESWTSSPIIRNLEQLVVKQGTLDSFGDAQLAAFLSPGQLQHRIVNRSRDVSSIDENKSSCC